MIPSNYLYGIPWIFAYNIEALMNRSKTLKVSNSLLSKSLSLSFLKTELRKNHLHVEVLFLVNDLLVHDGKEIRA